MKSEVMNIIKRILIHDTPTRNCDLELAEAVYEEIKPQVTNMTYAYVNGLIKLKVLPHIKSISRTRRELQKTYPETRGEVYDLRHNTADEVRDVININPTLALSKLS